MRKDALIIAIAIATLTLLAIVTADNNKTTGPPQDVIEKKAQKEADKLALAEETITNSTKDSTNDTTAPEPDTGTNTSEPETGTNTTDTKPTNSTTSETDTNTTDPTDPTDTNTTEPDNGTDNTTNTTNPGNETQTNTTQPDNGTDNTTNTTNPGNETQTNTTQPINETDNPTQPTNETDNNPTNETTSPDEDTSTNTTDPTDPGNETQTNTTQPINETDNNTETTNETDNNTEPDSNNTTDPNTDDNTTDPADPGDDPEPPSDDGVTSATLPGDQGWLYELQEASFTITLDEERNITWTVDGETLRTTTGSQDEFSWQPDILYTSNLDQASVIVTAGDYSRTWDVQVRNLINPYFEGEMGSSTVTIHVYTENDAILFNSLRVVLDNIEQDQTNTYTLTPESFEDNHETHWYLTLQDVPYGNNYLAQLIGTEEGTNETHTYNLATQRGHFRSFPERDDDNRRTTSRTTRVAPEELHLIYTIFAKDVIGTQDVQTLKLDAEDTNGDISAVTATIRKPDNTTRKLTLELVEGTPNYGTWKEVFGRFDQGKHELISVTITGENKQETIPVEDTSFYVTGTGGITNETLLLVYTTLSEAQTTNGSKVTLTLDAADSQGVSAVQANISTDKGDHETVSLMLTAGDEQYGTWEASIEAQRPDTTYRVESITITNNEGEQKTYEVESRSFYVKSLPPSLEEQERQARSNSITGRIVGTLSDVKNSPFAPFAAAVLLTMIIAGVWLSFR